MTVTFNRMFGIPVWHNRREVPKGALKWAKDFRDKYPTSVKMSNRGGYQHHVPREEFPEEFAQQIIERTDELPEYRISNLWLNINKKGDYNVTHNHGGADLSFIWYLTDAGNEEDQGYLIFRDPNSFGNVKFHRFLEYPGDHLEWKMKAGDFIAFPSYVEHSVEPYQGEEERITIAANCWIDDQPDDNT